MGQLVTPKQPQSEQLRDWYPYYAGFSSSFVNTTLNRHFQGATVLLDPWNGSGTTSAVAASRGLNVQGFDVNPAVTIIARARLAPVSVRASLVPIADEIIVAAQRAVNRPLSNDPLKHWFRAPAVAELRRLQRGINIVLVGSDDLEREMSEQPSSASSSIPLLGAFFYAALFATTRDLLRRFRATNPTWLRYPKTHRHRINPAYNHMGTLFRSRVAYLAERLIVPDDSIALEDSVTTASVLDLDAADAYDACLTSPPYATRVDYVRSSLAELAMMGLADNELAFLQAATIGSPRTRGLEASDSPLYSNEAGRIVEAVSTHPSHGSTNYYGPWIHRYMANLQQSLQRIDRSVTSAGRIGLVVQDSFYKTVHIDLQTVVQEMMQRLGRHQVLRQDYGVRHLFSNINSAARRHLHHRKNYESLLVFS